MLDVGLTGGIATGKSTVSQKLRELGAIILDADKAARKAVDYGGPAWEELRQWLGNDYFLPDGCLDRSRVGRLVFANETARLKLNSIVHPHVIRLLEDERCLLKKHQPDGIFIWDVPLLIEVGMQKMVEIVVLVTAPENVQIKRLMARDKLSQAEACQKLSSQMDLQRKKKFADYIIDNGGSLSFTYWQVEKKLWPKLLYLQNKKNTAY